MASACRIAALFLALAPAVLSHGTITWPTSRHGGTLAQAGHCRDASFSCFWFTQPTSIPHAPTLPHHMRTFNVNVSTGDPDDWSAPMPWRSPGAAPVFGSGCGLYGGNIVPLPNGGDGNGTDGILLPPVERPAVWPRGSVQKVGFALNANHGGGYSWRLCPLGGVVDEACFQRHSLQFEGDSHEIVHDNTTVIYDQTMKLPGFSIPRRTTTEGTYPAGSEWARMPIPACKLCDQSTCGPGLLPNLTDQFRSPLVSQLGYPTDRAYGGLPWFKQQVCAQHCAGFNVSTCPPGMLQFDEPANGLSGYYANYNSPVDGFSYSIMDRVRVPATLPAGAYLLSWRWDAEQTHQIWQNCADVHIVDSAGDESGPL